MRITSRPISLLYRPTPVWTPFNLLTSEQHSVPYLGTLQPAVTGSISMKVRQTDNTGTDDLLPPKVLNFYSGT